MFKQFWFSLLIAHMPKTPFSSYGTMRYCEVGRMQSHRYDLGINLNLSGTLQVLSQLNY